MTAKNKKFKVFTCDIYFLEIHGVKINMGKVILSIIMGIDVVVIFNYVQRNPLISYILTGIFTLGLCLMLTPWNIGVDNKKPNENDLEMINE